MKTVQTPELVTHMLKSLEEPNRELTEWERHFISGVRKVHEKYKRELTVKQFTILERIYAEKTA